MEDMDRKLTEWAAIAGKWSFQERSVSYSDAGDSAAGIALSPHKLRSGRISVKVRLGDPERCVGRILLGYDAETRSHYSVGLGGYEHAYTVEQSAASRGPRTSLAAEGDVSQLDKTAWYELEVELREESVTLTVNAIEVIKLRLRDPIGAQTGLLAAGDGGVEFRDFQVSGIPPKAFVVMQFEQPYDDLYREVIAPVCERRRFRVQRADDVFHPGIILQDIINGLVDSDVVIAEISPTNANVFYELGYAHALRKPTVLLARRGGTLPFDVSAYRVIFYDDTIGGKKDVEDSLDKHLANINRNRLPAGGVG